MSATVSTCSTTPSTPSAGAPTRRRWPTSRRSTGDQRSAVPLGPRHRPEHHHRLAAGRARRVRTSTPLTSEQHAAATGAARWRCNVGACRQGSRRTSTVRAARRCSLGVGAAAVQAASADQRSQRPAAAPAPAVAAVRAAPPSPAADRRRRTRSADASSAAAVATGRRRLPDGYPVKVKISSGIFHVPGGRFYERTTPDRCYPSAAAAEADGYRPSKA